MTQQMWPEMPSNNQSAAAESMSVNWSTAGALGILREGRQASSSTTLRNTPHITTETHSQGSTVHKGERKVNLNPDAFYIMPKNLRNS